MLVDRYGRRLPEHLEPPPDTEVYMGQHRDETRAQYERRRAYERTRDMNIAITIAVIVISALLTILLRRHS